MSRIASLLAQYRFCKVCDWQIHADQRYCPGCGRLLLSADPQTWSPAIPDLRSHFCNPVFWIQHLRYTSTDVDWIERELDIGPEAVNALCCQIQSDRKWPMAEIALAGGYSVGFVYMNYPEDACGQIYVDHPAWPEPIRLGDCGGHFQLPALRLPEVARIAGRATDGTPPWHTALLLLPGVYLTEWQLSIAAFGIQFCFACMRGCRRESAKVIGRQLASQLVTNIHWQRDASGWVCDSPHSRRHLGSNLSLSFEEFARLEEMLKTLEPRPS